MPVDQPASPVVVTFREIEKLLTGQEALGNIREAANRDKEASPAERAAVMAAVGVALIAVLKSAPTAKRSALAEAVLASREISDEFLLDPLIDGRKLLEFVGAVCRKG